MVKMKEIEIDCPCCESRLLIDVRTQTVLRHAPKASLDEFGKPVQDGKRWDAAARTVTDRESRSEDAFDSALNREKSRTRDLDDLFKKAQRKVDDRSRRHED
jgi:DNA-directed RNA polymerase subunit RPC12/RpoP